MVLGILCVRYQIDICETLGLRILGSLRLVIVVFMYYSFASNCDGNGRFDSPPLCC